MMQLARRTPDSATLKHRFVTLCALILALCVAHQFLMASERHAAVMGPVHQQAAAPSPLAVAMYHNLNLVAPAPGPLPGMPLPFMGDCPARQAIVPALFLLMLLVGGALGFGGWLNLLSAVAARPRAPSLLLGSPLAPTRRRALLQVFRI